MEEKGVFDVVNAVRLANRILGEKASALRLKLQVAGAFVTAEDRARFEASIADPEMKPFVAFLGFLSGEAKALAFQQADLFCFPTYYLGENQPVSLLEAMAYGLPIVTTRWRSLPEMFPADHPGIVPIRSPESIATSLLELMGSESGERSREWFLARFKLEVHLAKLAAALRSVETDDRLPQPPEGKRP
jgi:glycosyltransferase involved in cell wall biosynthesis